MNLDRDIERRLTDLYSAEANVRAPDRVLATALETIDDTKQRRRLIRAPWPFPSVNRNARLALVAVFAIAAGAIGLATFRPAGTGPGAHASPSPTASPRSFPTPDSSGNVAPIEAGRYALTGFPVDVSFEVPAGWQACAMSPLEQGVCGPDPSGRGEPGFVFTIVENVVASPCQDKLLDPPVGPTVDDLVAAISSLKDFQATAPVEVVVDGYHGKQFDLVTPIPLCALKTWATTDRVNGVGPGETNVLRIIDVDGARVMIAAAYFPAYNPPDTRSVQDAMAASVHFGP